MCHQIAADTQTKVDLPTSNQQACALDKTRRCVLDRLPKIRSTCCTQLANILTLYTVYYDKLIYKIRFLNQQLIQILYWSSIDFINLYLCVSWTPEQLDNWTTEQLNSHLSFKSFAQSFIKHHHFVCSIIIELIQSDQLAFRCVKRRTWYLQTALKGTAKSRSGRVLNDDHWTLWMELSECNNRLLFGLKSTVIIIFKKVIRTFLFTHLFRRTPIWKLMYILCAIFIKRFWFS